MAGVHSWLLLSVSLLVACVSDGATTCDEVDKKCHGSCNSLRTNFTMHCVSTVHSSQLYCPKNCKESYERLLAYRSLSELNFGLQYADCACNHAGFSHCLVRNGTMRVCKIVVPQSRSPSTLSTGAKETTGQTTTTTTSDHRSLCVTNGVTCLSSNSCRTLLRNVEQDCLQNSNDDSSLNSICSVQCSMSIRDIQTDALWKEVMCSPLVCRTNDSACEQVLRVKTMVNKCSISATSTVISTIMTTRSAVSSKNPNAGLTTFSLITTNGLIFVLFLLAFL